MQEQIPAVFKAVFHCVFGSFEALFFALGPAESFFFNASFVFHQFQSGMMLF